MIKLSERLAHLADMVTQGAVLADVGTDHGYIPIFLLEKKRIPRAFAMDIGRGPLLRAKEHIEASGLGDYIEVRLSDGVAALAPGEADAILIAGMGGGIILHILTEGRDVISQAKELILQPQSEIARVREYLYQNGYVIDREDMVLEEGKYYPMMHILPSGRDAKEFSSREERQVIYRYGECLLKDSNDILHQYLLHTLKQYEEIMENLSKQQDTPAIQARREQVEEEIRYAKTALMYWKDGAENEL